MESDEKFCRNFSNFENKMFFFSLKEMKLNLENVRRGSHGLTMEFMKSVPNFDMRY